MKWELRKKALLKYEPMTLYFGQCVYEFNVQDFGGSWEKCKDSIESLWGKACHRGLSGAHDKIVERFEVYLRMDKIKYKRIS